MSKIMVHQTQKTDIPVIVRQAIAEDCPFIFNSWLKSYKESHFARSMTNTVFYAEHHKVISRLLNSCEVYVACSRDDDDSLYGWAVGEYVSGHLVIHFIYVKQVFRNMGIGKLLLSQFNFNPESAALYTHNTRMGEKMAHRYKFVYHPYIALTPDYRSKEGVVKAPANIEEKLNDTD